MVFLNPAILFGLAAAAIPLIIHLFNFRRPRKIDFSSLVFVRELQRTTMQRVKVKQWLLLALRTLAIAALVLSFARPSVRGSLARALGGDGSRTVGILVDNSLSMMLRNPGGELIDQSRDAAQTVIDDLAASDEVVIRTTARSGMVDASGFSSPGSAADLVSAIVPEGGAGTLSTAIQSLAEELKSSARVNRELYVITDLQESTLLDSSAVTPLEDVALRVIPITAREIQNVGVGRVVVDSRIVEAGQPVQLSAQLTNYGNVAIDGYVVSVFLEDDRVGQASISLAPGESRSVPFTITPPVRGWLAGVVQGEDDDFESDNRRFFALHVPAERRVLVVQGDNEPVDYVTLALSRELGRNRISFDYDVIGEASLPATQIETYDTVILVGLQTISSGESASLSRYVSDGGGLMVFPGTSTREAELNTLLSAVGGGSVRGTIGSLGSRTAVTRLESYELEHDLFSGVFDMRTGSRNQRIEQPDVYYSTTYAPARGSEQTLITLANGQPFLQEMRIGQGAALYFSVAPNPVWSDFPVRGLFIPVLYRAIFYLSASEATSGDQLLVGRPGEFRVSGVAADTRLSITSPDGEDFIPEQRNLFSATLVSVDEQVSEPGVYDVRSGSELVRRIAFNLPEEESRLTSVSGDEAKEILEERFRTPVAVLSPEPTGAQALATELREARLGVELWNVFLAVALLLLLAEMVVEKQWRPEAAA
ncbi:MAG: BatA domain-containing protein [Rhodothermales bacterium]